MSRPAVEFRGLYWMSMNKICRVTQDVVKYWYDENIALRMKSNTEGNLPEFMLLSWFCACPVSSLFWCIFSRIFMPYLRMCFSFILSCLVSVCPLTETELTFIVFILSTTMFWYYSCSISVTFAKQFTSFRSLQSDTDNLWTVSLQNIK